MSEFIPGANPSAMDYLVHVWTHHREQFDKLLMQTIPELVLEPWTRPDGTPLLDENGEPEQLWVNAGTVSKAIGRQFGRELLARDFLAPLARDTDAWEALFTAAQTLVPLDAALAQRMEARQRMLSAFELRHLAGLMWQSEYDAEWPIWRSYADPGDLYEGDFGRHDPIPESYAREIGFVEDARDCNAEGSPRHRAPRHSEKVAG